MFVMSLTLLLAAPPPTGFTTALERLPLKATGGPVAVDVDGLAARVHLRGVSVTGAKSELCPTVEHERGGVVLRCTTRRLWAELTNDKAGLALTVRQLRGVIEDDLVLRAWPLRALSLPDSCPGTIAAAKGECALAQGSLEEAEAAFTQALDGPDANLARLRLGDFALRRGDPERALIFYSQVSPVGPVGRLARARTCDLTDACASGVEAREAFLTDGIPEPMKTELELYNLRWLTAAGHVDVAMAKMAARVIEQPSLCDHSTRLCQRLARAGLEADDEQTRWSALSVFLQDQVRNGPESYAVTSAAAEAAAKAGAPAFAAALLASQTRLVARDELDSHLLRVTQLYLTSGDRVRAQFIIDYATEKLGPLATAGWLTVRRAAQPAAPRSAAAALKPSYDVADLEREVDLTSELARAASLRSRAAVARQGELP